MAGWLEEKEKKSHLSCHYSQIMILHMQYLQHTFVQPHWLGKRMKRSALTHSANCYGITNFLSQTHTLYNQKKKKKKKTKKSFVAKGITFLPTF